MSKIDSLDFAEYVNTCKDNLQTYLQTKGKDVSKNTPLDTLIDINSTLTISDPDLYRAVYNYDGSLISMSSIKVGDSIIPPSEDPAIDDPRLTFVRWASTVDEDVASKSYAYAAVCNVTEQINVDGQLIRPTLIDMILTTDSGLSPSLRIRFYAGNPLYIDWGDDNISKFEVPAGHYYQELQAPHTYADYGNYTIKIYSASYYGFQSGSFSAYVFGSEKLNKSVQNIYCGDNFYKLAYALWNTTQLKKLIITDSCRIGDGDIESGSIDAAITYSNYSLNGLVIIKPSNIINYAYYTYRIGDYCYLNNLFIENDLKISLSFDSNNSKLTNLIIPNSIHINLLKAAISLRNLTWNINNITSPQFILKSGLKYLDLSNWPFDAIATSCFDGNSLLEKVILPNTINIINNYAFSYCSSLKSINIPDSVISLGSTGVLSRCYQLENISFPQNFNWNFQLSDCYNLSDTSFIDLANKLKDLTGQSSKTIKLFYTGIERLKHIYLDEFGKQVTSGGISVLEFINNKNWTLTV